MRIVVGSDHAGPNLQSIFSTHLNIRGAVTCNVSTPVGTTPSDYRNLNRSAKLHRLDRDGVLTGKA